MNGHGPTWRVVAVAAAVVVMALIGASWTSLAERVRTNEADVDTLKRDSAETAEFRRDMLRRMERMDTKLDRLLEPRGIVQYSLKRDK